MRLVSTNSIEPGTILAQSIYNESGQILLHQGLELTMRMIERLTTRGITYVYIEDDLTSDIHIESPISERLRLEATHTIKETFSEMQKDGFMKNSFILDKNGKKLVKIVQDIMDELHDNSKTLSLLADIFVTDDYIFQHSLNVTIYSLAIGLELKFTEKELSEIGIGAMLHDIGKVFIEKEILQKPGNLTDEEFEMIQSHAQLGYDFLRKQHNIPLKAALCAFQHHERLDGSGYPRGIKDGELHKYAKLIGVADVFDAVTSNRVYRDAMLPHEGLEILYAGAVKLFDKDMVEAFKKVITIYPNGLSVALSNGTSGIIVRQNKYLCDRPIVRIFKENDSLVNSSYELDLGSALNVTITSCNVE